MTLNPQVEALLGFFAQMPPIDYETISPADLRAANRPLAVEAPLAVADVWDFAIELPGRTIGARLYTPVNAQTPLPLVLFYHGGGWVIGNLETHDGTARALARASGAAVLAVDYRLAPETPFPGPLDDCHEALLWARDHAAELGIDAGQIALAGDSAGGNLAAAVAMRARDTYGPGIAHQLLIYPVTDADFGNGSYSANGEGYFLTTAMMRWFWQQYVGDEISPHHEAAILRHPNLKGLPPATVIVAEFDPLRDEGLAYADALGAAGVPVTTMLAPGMIHGFFSMYEAVPDALPFIDAAGAALQAAFAGSR